MKEYLFRKPRGPHIDMREFANDALALEHARNLADTRSIQVQFYHLSYDGIIGDHIGTALPSTWGRVR